MFSLGWAFFLDSEKPVITSLPPKSDDGHKQSGWEAYTAYAIEHTDPND